MSEFSKYSRSEVAGIITLASFGALSLAAVLLVLCALAVSFIGERDIGFMG